MNTDKELDQPNDIEEKLYAVLEHSTPDRVDELIDGYMERIKKSLENIKKHKRADLIARLDHYAFRLSLDIKLLMQTNPGGGRKIANTNNLRQIRGGKRYA